LFSITNNSEGFESSSLTGLGLFLNGFDLHDFFRKLFIWEEGLDDLLFLDWDGKSEDINDVI